MLLVNDVDRGGRFYRDVLGGKLSAVYPELPPHEWASLDLDRVELMLWERRAAKREYPGLGILENPAGLIIYIYIDDVDALYEWVKGKAEALMEPVDQFYGIRNSPSATHSDSSSPSPRKRAAGGTLLDQGGSMPVPPLLAGLAWTALSA